MVPVRNQKFSSYSEFIKECDRALKMGHGQEVASLLGGLNLARIPDEWRLPIAKMCRRARMPTQGLKILSPIVHPNHQPDVNAKPEELVEYAALLNMDGCVQEAIDILNDQRIAEVPLAGLFRAFCHFTRWEYAEAIPFLEIYLQSTDEPYARAVGWVNLISALIAVGRHEEANERLVDLIEICQAENHKRLLANCLELRAQVRIIQRRFGLAEDDLKNANTLLSADGTNDQLYIRKWSVVVRALATNDVTELRQLKEEANRRGEWEVVRDTVFNIQKVSFNADETAHLYFGTPYSAYRRRIHTDLGFEPQEPFLRIGPADSPCLDVVTGTIGSHHSLFTGEKNHQLFAILLRDLYRPMSVGSLFADLFPGEHFNIFSSPNRVHQTIRRARRWIEENQLPLEIIETGGQYRLLTRGSFSFLLPLESTTITWREVQLQKLKCLYRPGDKILPSEASEKLGISPSGFRKVTSWAVAEGRLQKQGSARATFYLFQPT